MFTETISIRSKCRASCDGIHPEQASHSPVYPRIRGSLHVTFEEGTGHLVYDLRSDVRRSWCATPRNALLKEGSRGASMGERPSCCAPTSPTVFTERVGYERKELARSYLTIARSRTVMSAEACMKLGDSCAGKQVYALRHRSEWLGKSRKPAAPSGGVLLSQFDA